MSDLIERKMAIESIEFGVETLKIALDRIDVTYNEREKFSWGIGLLESYIADMKDLPSAQPEITEDDVKEYCRKRCLIVITNDFYNEMYRRWVSAQPHWISCSERFPKEGQECLVCDHGTISIDTFLGLGNPYNWKCYVKDYEAWMPLPETYGGKSE